MPVSASGNASEVHLAVPSGSCEFRPFSDSPHVIWTEITGHHVFYLGGGGSICRFSMTMNNAEALHMWDGHSSFQYKRRSVGSDPGAI